MTWKVWAGSHPADCVEEALRTYFTLTAGRLGSAWLADFLLANLSMAFVHEPLGIDDSGARMPDIRTMRTLNNFGNTQRLMRFWRAKFGAIDADAYAETNHTLSKCGPIENLSASRQRNDHHFKTRYGASMRQLSPEGGFICLTVVKPALVREPIEVSSIACLGGDSALLADPSDSFHVTTGSA